MLKKTLMVLFMVTVVCSTVFAGMALVEFKTNKVTGIASFSFNSDEDADNYLDLLEEVLNDDIEYNIYRQGSYQTPYGTFSWQEYVLYKISSFLDKTSYMYSGSITAQDKQQNGYICFYASRDKNLINEIGKRNVKLSPEYSLKGNFSTSR